MWKLNAQTQENERLSGQIWSERRSVLNELYREWKERESKMFGFSKIWNDTKLYDLKLMKKDVHRRNVHRMNEILLLTDKYDKKLMFNFKILMECDEMQHRWCTILENVQDLISRIRPWKGSVSVEKSRMISNICNLENLNTKNEISTIEITNERYMLKNVNVTRIRPQQFMGVREIGIVN
jgi:hypothetical protein